MDSSLYYRILSWADITGFAPFAIASLAVTLIVSLSIRRFLQSLSSSLLFVFFRLAPSVLLLSVSEFLSVFSSHCLSYLSAVALLVSPFEQHHDLVD